MTKWPSLIDNRICSSPIHRHFKLSILHNLPDASPKKPRPLEKAVSCTFDADSCGWNFGPSMWHSNGFVHSDQHSWMRTDLHLPLAQVQQLNFAYRLVPLYTSFKFILQCLTSVFSMDAIQSMAWKAIWSGGSSGPEDGWRQGKAFVPRSVVALKFEMFGAEVSIDSIFLVQPVSVPYAHVVVGGDHACILHVSVQQIRCWGNNQYGQLGQGHGNNIGSGPNQMGDNLPAVNLGTGRSAKHVAAGMYHTCALLDDDFIKCWGRNADGQLGQGHGNDIGRNPNEMGDNLSTVSLGTGRIAKHLAVDSCGYHTCALLDDDSIKCWGRNGQGQLGQGHWSNIGSGPNQMGDNLPSVNLGTGRSVKLVEPGAFFTCALLDDDSSKCWGYNIYGQLGQGHWSNIGTGPNQMGDNLPAVNLGTGRSAKHLACGAHYTCVLLDDDSTKCWGNNYFGQLGHGHQNTIGWDASHMGDNLLSVNLGTGRSAKHIATGHSHTCAVLDDDSMKCWGYGFEGNLGQGQPDDIGTAPNQMGDNLPPIDLGTGLRAKHSSPGWATTCALLDDDSTKCWGYGGSGNLGQGNAYNMGDSVNSMGDNLPAIDFGAVGLGIRTDIRIVDGTKMHGRIQVQYQNSWRDICDDSWSNNNAQVACRQLGLAGGVSSFQWHGSGDFGMDEVVCGGTEVDLGQCSFRGWGIHDCTAQEAAGVECNVDAWSRISDPNISARKGHSAIWDSIEGSMLVFAGHAAGFFQYYSDLWRYTRDGLWERLQTGPSPRGGHTAIWDLASRTMLVFGGSFYTTYYDELWLYSDKSNAWTLSSPSTKPSARAYHSAVWDSAGQMMLVFAGESGATLQDFWQYHLVSNHWKEFSPSSNKPSARSRHTAVWMDGLGGMLMFGGWGATALNDLWHYGQWTNSWTLLSSDPPSSRAGHAAIWEPLTLSMLTFGGVQLDESLNYSAELWNYSLLTNSWSPLAPVGPYPSPGPREDHTAVWDPSSGFLFLLGGFDGSYKSDFWRYKSMGFEQVPVKECALGQECTLQFKDESFEEGERLQVVDVLNGLNSHIFMTSDGYNFSLSLENATEGPEESDGVDDGPFLLAEPGLYQIRHCFGDSTCDGQWFALGLLLVVGPFSGQSFVCDMGSRCAITGLQGSRLSMTDQLLALKECGTSIHTSTFEPRPINASQAQTDLLFDFGNVELEGLAPEQVQLCWCPEGCSDLQEFRALAMLLYVVCPPGQRGMKQ